MSGFCFINRCGNFVAKTAFFHTICGPFDSRHRDRFENSYGTAKIVISARNPTRAAVISSFFRTNRNFFISLCAHYSPPSSNPVPRPSVAVCRFPASWVVLHKCLLLYNILHLNNYGAFPLSFSRSFIYLRHGNRNTYSLHYRVDHRLLRFVCLLLCPCWLRPSKRKRKNRKQN